MHTLKARPHFAIVRNRVAYLAVLLTSVQFSQATEAAEVRVFAAGAAKAAMLRIAADFERETSDKVIMTVDTVGAIQALVSGGAPGDIVIVSHASLAKLIEGGRVSANRAVPVGSIAIGLAVKRGTPVPDLSTPDAVRRALLSAPSIAHADPARGATAGLHFVKVVEALGLTAALKDRMVIFPTGLDAVEAVAAGRFAIGVSQTSEIAPHEGLTLVGGLPEPHALTTQYSVGFVIGQPTSAAELLFTRITGDAGRSHWQSTGFSRSN